MRTREWLQIVALAILAGSMALVAVTVLEIMTSPAFSKGDRLVPAITFGQRWAPALLLPPMHDRMYRFKDKDKLPPPIRTRFA